MSPTRFIYGFHAILAKLRHQPEAIQEIFIDAQRQDARARDLLKHAEGESALNHKTQREGIVWKCLDDGDLSFKAISNAWLIKNKE